MSNNYKTNFEQVVSLQEENERLANELNYFYLKDKEKTNRIEQLVNEKEMLKCKLNNVSTGKSTKEIELEATNNILLKEKETLEVKYRKLLEIQGLMAKNEEILKEKLDKSRNALFSSSSGFVEQKIDDKERAILFVEESLKRMETVMGLQGEGNIVDRASRVENQVMNRLMSEKPQLEQNPNFDKIFDAVEKIEKRLTKVESKKPKKVRRKTKK